MSSGIRLALKWRINEQTSPAHAQRYGVVWSQVSAFLDLSRDEQESEVQRIAKERAEKLANAEWMAQLEREKADRLHLAGIRLRKELIIAVGMFVVAVIVVVTGWGLRTVAEEQFEKSEINLKAARSALDDAKNEKQQADDAFRRSNTMMTASFGMRTGLDPITKIAILREITPKDAHHIAGWKNAAAITIQDKQALMARMEGHKDRISSIDVSSDNLTMITGSDDGSARFWNIDGSGEPIILAEHSGPITNVAFSPSASMAVTVSEDFTGTVWNLRNREQPNAHRKLIGHTDGISCVAFSPDGSHVVTGSWDGTARIWSLNKSTPPIVFEGHTRAITSVAFSPNGSLAVSGSEDHTAQVWRADGWGQPRQLGTDMGRITSADFSLTCDHVVIGSSNGSARIIDTNDFEESLPLESHEYKISSVAFSPSGLLVATGSLDKTVRIWNVDGSNRERPIVLDGHNRPIVQIANNSNGTKFALGSEDGHIAIWEMNPPRRYFAAKRHRGSILRLAFHPNKARLYSLSSDNTVRTWFVGDLYQRLWQLTPHCLPASRRNTLFGETREKAQQGYDDCLHQVAKRHNRAEIH